MGLSCPPGRCRSPMANILTKAPPVTRTCPGPGRMACLRNEPWPVLRTGGERQEEAAPSFGTFWRSAVEEAEAGLESSSSNELVAFLNSRMPLPMALPTSGSLPGPKMINARTRMITSSVAPIPNMPTRPLCQVGCAAQVFLSISHCLTKVKRHAPEPLPTGRAAASQRVRQFPCRSSVGAALAEVVMLHRDAAHEHRAHRDSPHEHRRHRDGAHEHRAHRDSPHEYRLHRDGAYEHRAHRDSPHEHRLHRDGTQEDGPHEARADGDGPDRHRTQAIAGH